MLPCVLSVIHLNVAPYQKRKNWPFDHHSRDLATKRHQMHHEVPVLESDALDHSATNAVQSKALNLVGGKRQL